jgi:hypothetical protein
VRRIYSSQLTYDGAQLERDAYNRYHKRHNFHCDDDHPRYPFFVTSAIGASRASVNHCNGDFLRKGSDAVILVGFVGYSGVGTKWAPGKLTGLVTKLSIYKLLCNGDVTQLSACLLCV